MDEFGTNLLNSVPSANLRTISFRQTIEALDVEAQHFLWAVPPALIDHDTQYQKRLTILP